MLRRKLQANCQLLLGGKGQWGQGRMGGLIWHLPNAVELPPSRCPAQSALCFPRDHHDSQRLQGKGQQAGSSVRAVGSTRPGLDQPSTFISLPGGLCRDSAWGYTPILGACMGTLRAGPYGYAPNLGDSQGIPA